MKKSFLFSLVVFISCFRWMDVSAQTEQEKKDTVKVGIYITSIHDIDFKQKEYSINFWLWLTYKRKEFDFSQNLEVPQAKTVTKSFYTVDSSDGKIFMEMKLQCVMKDSWKINHFPFDKQILRLSIENSQYDIRSLVFVPDTLGQHFDPRFTLSGWNIDSCIITTGVKAYETAFGDATLSTPHTDYSSFRIKLSLQRNAAGLFWKMFLGMYIAFLIGYISFYIHSDSIDSRFGINVGALFAVIGNKYIIDSALPESTTYTLVDTLHGLTLFFIFGMFAATAYSLTLIKNQKHAKAKKFDMGVAQVLLGAYLILNIFFIMQAFKG